MALPPIEDRYPGSRSKVTKRIHLGQFLGVIENVRQPHNAFTFGQLDGLNTNMTYVTLTQNTTIPTTPFTLRIFAPYMAALHQTNREWHVNGREPIDTTDRLVAARKRITKNLQKMEAQYPPTTSPAYVTSYIFENADVFKIMTATVLEINVWPAAHNFRYYGYLHTLHAHTRFNQTLKNGTLFMRRNYPTTNKHYVEFVPSEINQVRVC